MLAIEIELLTGRYVATAYNDRGSAEWPPHPSRLFAAFVATWAEDEGTEDERAALSWLEGQEPPRIVASEASRRTVAPVFVPINDIQTVAEPDGARTKLAEAEATLVLAEASGEPKQLKKAKAAHDKAQTKLRSDTVKATASPKKVTSEDMKSVRSVLPETRMRQPRTFPSVTPEDPKVLFIWTAEPPEPVQQGLSSLCHRVSRLGHSSSLVRAHVRSVQEAPETAYMPDEGASDILRVPGPGQMDRLQEAFTQHQGLEPRILATRFSGYRKGGRAVFETAGSDFGTDWIVFERSDGDVAPMKACVGLAEALRKTLLSHAAQPAPSALTGHEPDGSKTERAHVAFIALPNVANPYASGDIMGMAMVLPKAMPLEDRQAVLAAVTSWEANPGDKGKCKDLRLWAGKLGHLCVRRVAFGESPKRALQPGAWCEAGRVWGTATPIALDRNPGDLQSPDPAKRAKAFAEAEATVVRACGHIGLPEPEYVEVVTSVVITGSAKPREFPPFPAERHKHRRVLVHARLVFEEPVRGPILLGAGRYFGLGLCRPLRSRGKS